MGKGLVAIVTGSNKGIGYELCRLFANSGFSTIFCSRDVNRGLQAFYNLKKQLHQETQEQELLYFHQLDIADPLSISCFVSWIESTFGGLDILVNNAAIGGTIIDVQYMIENNLTMHDLLADKTLSKAFIVDHTSAKECLDTNYYGTKAITKALLPLFRQSMHGGRIINVGSIFGKLDNLQSMQLRKEISDIDNLSEDYIDKLLNNYLRDVKGNAWKDKGWPPTLTNYKMSKIALHAYTRVLAKELEESAQKQQKVYVNCVHPGYVQTEMTGHFGERTAQEGAMNIFRLALLPVNAYPSGKFFNEGNIDEF